MNVQYSQGPWSPMICRGCGAQVRGDEIVLIASASAPLRSPRHVGVYPLYQIFLGVSLGTCCSWMQGIRW